MDSSRTTLTAVTGGVVVITLLAFLALSGVAATFAWMEGGGNGGGPGVCQSITSGTSSATPAVPSTLGGNTPTCVPPSEIGAQVVAWARAMADALYVSPACGGRISYPDCYDTWYKAPGTDYPPGVPTFRQAVIQL